MFKGLLASVFGGFWGYVAAGAVAAIATVALTHVVDRGIYQPQIDAKQKQYDDFVLASVKASAAAASAAAHMQHQQDEVAKNAAVAEAKAQQATQDVTHKLQETIYVHVPDTAHCITYGLVRVLNAAAAGRSDPNSLDLAPGKSDDACAPVSWRAFAADLTDDYGIGHQNAEQLDSLENTVRTLHAASKVSN